MLLGAHCIPNADAKAAQHFNDLFKIDVTREDFNGAKPFIANCIEYEWPPSNTNLESERDVMLAIAKNILVNLSPDVIMEKRYREAVNSILAKDPTLPLDTSNLGMGHLGAWHGTIDTRVMGSIVICQGDVMHEDEEDGVYEDEVFFDMIEESTTNLEGKISYGWANLPQAIAISVVSSFTIKGLSDSSCVFVPTILIDKKSFKIILYDCERDVLLLSNAVPLGLGGHLSQTAMATLWAVFNHRSVTDRQNVT